MRPEHLCSTNPLHYADKDIDNIHSAEWYANTCAQMVKDPTKEAVIAVILYTDKTQLSPFAHLGLEPLLFSLSIFKREMRNQPIFWRSVAYYPDYKDEKSFSKTAVSHILSC